MIVLYLYYRNLIIDRSADLFVDLLHVYCTTELIYSEWKMYAAGIQFQRYSAEVAVRQKEISCLLSLRGNHLRHVDCPCLPQTERLHKFVRRSNWQKSPALAPVLGLLEVWTANFIYLLI